MRGVWVAWLLLVVITTAPAALAQRKKDEVSEPKVERPEREAAAPPVKEEIRDLNLAVGESQTISAVNVESYSDVRDIAKVKLTPDATKFLVVGEKPGTATLLLIMKDKTQVKYAINVFARDMRRVEAELLQLLEGAPGIRVRRIGARLFIEGGVSAEAELKRINQIAALFPGQVESLVVQGGVAAARQINIRVDFFFVQYDRSGSYQFGVSWPGRIGGPGITQVSADYDLLAGAATSAQASVVDQPLPGLDMAARNGWAKVLKHSTVITANGAEAQFSSGGEQNYVVTSGLAAALTPIRFGTDVTVLPRYDPTLRELEVKVAAEVMDLTPPVAAGTDLPGRNVSKLSTLVSLKLGQSIVLSGIRSRAQRHTVGGLPLLSELPLLGILFGSHGDSKEEVEGAIFVVPSVIESIPKGAQEIIDEALAQYESFSGDMDDVNAWEKDPARAPGVRTKPDQPKPDQTKSAAPRSR